MGTHISTHIKDKQSDRQAKDGDTPEIYYYIDLQWQVLRTFNLWIYL